MGRPVCWISIGESRGSGWIWLSRKPWLLLPRKKALQDQNSSNDFRQLQKTGRPLPIGFRGICGSKRKKMVTQRSFTRKFPVPVLQKVESLGTLAPTGVLQSKAERFP